MYTQQPYWPQWRLLMWCQLLQQLTLLFEKAVLEQHVSLAFAPTAILHLCKNFIEQITISLNKQACLKQIELIEQYFIPLRCLMIFEPALLKNAVINHPRFSWFPNIWLVFRVEALLLVLWSTQRLSTFMSTQRISQHVDIIFNISTKEQWKNKMSIITWEAAMSYATTFN